MPSFTLSDSTIHALVQQDSTVKVTFTQGAASGLTQTINGTTYNVYNATFAFDPDSVTYNRGNKGTLTISLDPSSTNGWQLYEFFVKNPQQGSGLDATAFAGNNGKIVVNNQNLTVGTYSYGVILLNPSLTGCATFDPTIVDQGGGQGRR